MMNVEEQQSMNGAGGSASAATASFFKQIDEKHTSQAVTQMLWNPKMDLIALAFSSGDLHLYRLSWQRVWSITSPHQNLTISSMAWRPDGKVLAVSYANGHLRLLAVEDAKKIFSFNCNEPIECLYWIQEDDEMYQKHEANNFYEDSSASLLPKPISYDIISQLFEKTNVKDFPDNLFIKEIKNLTYLVCTHGTSIAIFVYGYFLLLDANLDLVPSHLNYKQLKSCFLSDNSSLISTLGLTDENLLVYSLLDARILHENYFQIKLISTKFGMLFSMLTVLKTVIKEMEELWEDILVEMDQKFQLYALEKYSNCNNKNGTNNNQNASGTNAPNTTNAPGSDSSLVNDFMLLYAFGSCSEHFKTFLLQDLTEKGVKKLEISVENYYSNIQRLLNGNFHQLSLCMFYHLNELYGMSKWFDKFKIFSITEQQINDVLNNCASLIIKAQELNYVIDLNLKEIKIFFKWLHASILHLSDDQPATDMIRFNEEMENSIVDFIQSTFKDAQTINLEKVGQYLKSDNLKVHLTEENNWQTFLKLKLNPKDNQYLYLSKREKSLIGCFEEFKQSLNECFKCQAIRTKEPFAFIKQYNIHKFNSLQDANEMSLSYKCAQNSMITGLLMAKSNNECYILKHSITNDPEVKAFILNLSSHTMDLSQISLQDVYIYGENNVTLLGTDNKTSSNTYLIQLNLQSTPTSILNDLIEVTSYSENSSTSDSRVQDASSSSSSKETNLLMIKAEKLSADSIVKCIRKLKCAFFCVSSTRKVAALLAANKHRVKLFELEVEEEDDEVMEEENDDAHDNEESVYMDKNNLSKDSDTKPGTKTTITPKLEETFDDFNIPSTNNSNNNNKSLPSGGSFYPESNKFESTVRQFAKQQSAGSTCSIATSVCSSTAATIGSLNTSAGASSMQHSNSQLHQQQQQRNKRKKNFDDEDDDDDQAADDLPFNADANSDIVNFKSNFTVGDHIEIVANQDGSQQLNNQNNSN